MFFARMRSIVANNTGECKFATQLNAITGTGVLIFIRLVIVCFYVNSNASYKYTNNRRSHHALKATSIIKDKESGNLRLPHHIDEATGMYRGKQIFTPKVKAAHKSKVKGVSTAPVAKSCPRTRARRTRKCRSEKFKRHFR